MYVAYVILNPHIHIHALMISRGTVELIRVIHLPGEYIDITHVKYTFCNMAFRLV